jgi:chorismate synthase
MIELLTAGESHGKGLTAIINGIPSNLEISEDYLNEQLKRRQAGYGRGLRMKIETDTAEFLSGVRFGKTLGSPISIFVKNRDWENWTEKMCITPIDNHIEKITVPRPGHADLVGVMKYNFNDIRNSIERSSARETAARVAACSITRKFLNDFGIEIGSYVESIGGIYPKENFINKFFDKEITESFNAEKINKLADKSEVRVLDADQENKIISKIKVAKKRGDTVGGTFYIIITGLPVGLGSFMQYDTKLDAELSQALMSIQAVKGVEIGLGFEMANLYGSQVHDEIILRNNKFTRKTNHSGGIEGGISTGLPIIIRAEMKPISTLMSPLQSVDLAKMKSVQARRERSDFCAVPACAVIGESVAAWTLAKFFLQKFSGDSMEEVKDNFESYTKQVVQRLKTNFYSK